MKKVFLTRVQFDQWVKDMIKSYNNRGTAYKNVRRLTMDDTQDTIILNKRNGRTAMARYDGTNKYSPELGLAVAWAKFKNLPIPFVATIVCAKELKYLDKFYLGKNTDTEYTYIGSLESNPDYFIARTNDGKLEELPYYFAKTDVKAYRVERYRL